MSTSSYERTAREIEIAIVTRDRELVNGSIAALLGMRPAVETQSSAKEDAVAHVSSASANKALAEIRHDVSCLTGSEGAVEAETVS